jgi:flagellin-like protein
VPDTTRGQSEVVGVILLVGVVTIAIGGAGAVYLSSIADESEPTADVRVTVTDEAVALTHNGGSPLSVDSLRVMIREDGSETNTDWADGTVTGDGDDSFEPSETWQQNGFSFDPSDRIEVLLVHDPSGTLLVREVGNPTVD